MDRQLAADGLTLRAPRPGDGDSAWQRWAQDPQVLRHLGWRPHTDPVQTRQQIDWDIARWLKRSAWTWMLLPDGESRPVGLVQLIPVGAGADAPPHHLRLGFLLARPWQGRGLMGRAVRTVIDHALAQPAVWRVDAVVDLENAASIRLLERAGMVREGRLARHTVHPALGMNPRDVWLYARWREAADGV